MAQIEEAPDTHCNQDEQSYTGNITGYTGTPDDIEVTLSRPGELRTIKPAPNGCFTFHDLQPGQYAIKVNAKGHRTTAARIIDIPQATGFDNKPYALEVLPADPNIFTYHWEEDPATVSGAEYSSQAVTPRYVQFQNTTVEVVDLEAADKLQRDYNILLVGDGWIQEYAHRLFITMNSIPQTLQQPYYDRYLPPSTWKISHEHIDDDILWDVNLDESRQVTLSARAFVNATPRMATIEGKKGRWFSRRLHHAAVRFITDNGANERAYEKILQERYGITTRIPDYYELTTPTGKESERNFQKFHPEEILAIINMFEEMPTGMQRIEGMRYLLRRLNGLDHPLYPQAPAVAWPESAYVEFMETAFKDQPEQFIHRLILHEKAHFLWAHLFDEQLKADWIELGGWYENPTAASGWSATKSAEFVSAYAHSKNPDEDMAESISFFIANPDGLRARSPEKYEFIRDRIMQGDIYVATIREDLTFEVYNLYPDYTYPGKIKRIDIIVEGDPQDDKILTVELEIHATNENEYARHGYTRIESEIGTFFDLWLEAVDEHGNSLYYTDGPGSTLLRGQKTISKHLKAGYWIPKNLWYADIAGNKRFAGISDFGWRMHVDNAREDYFEPEYIPNSLHMSVSQDPDPRIQYIHLEWDVQEETGIKERYGCLARIQSAQENTYSIDKYGNPAATTKCQVQFTIPDYMPSSEYYVRYIRTSDDALNKGYTYFTGSRATEPEVSVHLQTNNPDTSPPEIDVNRIRISAQPTNWNEPNGETEVTISLDYRDDNSGVRIIRGYLRDPQGGTHHYFLYTHYNEGDDRGLFPNQNPKNWKHWEKVIILPPGSLPGIWGLAELVVWDRARNANRYNFVEIARFVVEN